MCCRWIPATKILVKKIMKQQYDEILINCIIQMAWADDISFDKIKNEYGISEAEVIKIMRHTLKLNSFKLWRKRVSGRFSKHEKKQTYRGIS